MQLYQNETNTGFLTFSGDIEIEHEVEMGQKSQAKWERGAKMDLKSFCPGLLNEIGIDKIIHTPANFNQSTEK